MWTLPSSLPNHLNWKEIGFDTETKDPDLREKGPGFVYGNAHIIGFSIYADDGYNEYFPIRHENGQNFEGQWKGWLTELMAREDLTVVTANGRYDMEGLAIEGIKARAKIVDIQVVEALLDEDQTSYSLENILKRRGLPTKDKGVMDEELVRRGYVVARGKDKGKPDYSKIYLLEPQFVAEYAMYDAGGTFATWQQQKIEIDREDLQQVLDLEIKLGPILLDMRLRGVPIDESKAHVLNEDMIRKCAELMQGIEHDSMMEINPFSTDQLAYYLDTIGVVVPKTEKYINKKGKEAGGNDSVTTEFLKGIDDPVCKMLAEYRTIEKIRRDFVEGMVLEGSYKGRLHPQWFQTRGSSFMSGDDVNGTRSGRIGCVNPNLAQIPSRDPVWGPLVRSLFISETGLWCKGDYSQQEPRNLLHFAFMLKLAGSAAARQIYIDKPDTDYHQMMTDRVNAVRPPEKPILRKHGKDVNLGLAYGLGKVKMADKLNLPMSESNNILESYHEANPFVRQLQNKCIEVANSRGYVRTILGRRRRFNQWEAVNWSKSRGRTIRDRDAAIAEWGVVRRAMVHKALNSIVQGSSADQMKRAMIDLYGEGFRPYITLYDETGTPVKSPEDGKRIKEIMEHAIEFTVPHYVDPVVKKSWGG